MKRYIIGVDPGLTKVNPLGVGILRCDTGSLALADEIQPNEKLDWLPRIVDLVDRLSTLVNKFVGTGKVVGVGFEAPFTGPNVATGLKLAYIGGSVLYQSSIWGAAFVEFHPTQVKKQFAGSGRAEKFDMIAEVVRRYKVEVGKDAADAVAVAYCTIHSLEAGGLM